MRQAIVSKREIIKDIWSIKKKEGRNQSFFSLLAVNVIKSYHDAQLIKPKC